MLQPLFVWKRFVHVAIPKRNTWIPVRSLRKFDIEHPSKPDNLVLYEFDGFPINLLRLTGLVFVAHQAVFLHFVWKWKNEKDKPGPLRMRWYAFKERTYPWISPDNGNLLPIWYCQFRREILSMIGLACTGFVMVFFARTAGQFTKKIMISKDHKLLKIITFNLWKNEKVHLHQAGTLYLSNETTLQSFDAKTKFHITKSAHIPHPALLYTVLGAYRQKDA